MRPRPTLFDLMPAVHRRRDGESGGALEALLEVLQAQQDLLRDDVASLYADWFVETCEPWLLPYLGELVAAGRLARRLHPRLNTRALVADTLGHRRRKGTASALEEVLSYATGWSVRVAEPRGRTGQAPTTRTSAHAGPRSPSLADAMALSRAGGPFDPSPRLPDLARGPDAVEIRIWTLEAAPVAGVEAGSAAGGDERRTFHPLGLDAPLFNVPVQAATPASDSVRELPLPLTRAALAQDLRAGGRRFGWLASPPAFAVRIGGEVLEAHELAAADLSDWRAAAAPTVRAVVDPELGRLLVPRPQDRALALTVDHGQAVAADIGGGGYPRAPSPRSSDRRQWGGWTEPAKPVGRSADALAEALDAWSESRGDGALRLGDSRTHRPPPGAARRRWRVAVGERNLAVDAVGGARPCLIGDLDVSAEEPGGVLLLAGLTIGGVIRVRGPLTLVLRDATVLAPNGGPAVRGARGAACRIVVERSIVAGLDLGPEARLAARSSLLTESARSRRGPGAPVEGLYAASLNACTVGGALRVRTLQAVDTLFVSAPEVEGAASESRLSYCWLPGGGRPPADRHHCLSDSPSGADGLAPAPRFSSLHLGQPGFLRWKPGEAPLLETGASDGQAIGAHHDEGMALRRDNYADALTEHLPVHLHAVPTYLT